MRFMKRNRGNNAARFLDRGFTLVELMTVAAIVTILAAVAYPSYQESVRKTKRAEGRAALMQLMQQQERYYSQNNKYVAFSSASADQNARKFNWYSGGSAAKSAYEIEASSCPSDVIENCVLLTARPGTDKVDSGYKDAKCGNLMLSSTGKKTSSGGAVDCWQ
jgi:type IV pilus assembly protein PilE